MAEFGSDREILEFAISREVEAYHFYMALAQPVDNLEIGIGSYEDRPNTADRARAART